MTPEREQDLLSQIGGLTDENYRLRHELRKIASENYSLRQDLRKIAIERAQQIASLWDPPEIRVSAHPTRPSSIEVRLSPVYSRLEILNDLYFESTEVANRMIAEDIAKKLVQEIEKQLKVNGDPV
jgi:hypothetical protein